MIDIHSHILPNIDDGSRSVDQSLEMLKLLKDQKIDTVAATPHFDADRETASAFIERRNIALSSLKEKMSYELPKIVCGAEVGFYNGISRMKELDELCIDGSDLLLLEMPMKKWSEYDIKDLEALTRRGDITVVLAHIERYLRLQSKEAMRRVYECGALFQCNADFFLDLFTRYKAMSMLKSGEIQFIGSDCHNTSSRSPRIGDAYAKIEKKLGKVFLERFDVECRCRMKIK